MSSDTPTGTNDHIPDQELTANDTLVDNFTRVPNALLRSDKLDPYEKLLFALIVSYPPPSYIGYRKLQKWSGLCPEKITKSLRKLEGFGLIRRYKRLQRVYYVAWYFEESPGYSELERARFKTASSHDAEPLRPTMQTASSHDAEPLRPTMHIKKERKLKKENEDLISSKVGSGKEDGWGVPDESFRRVAEGLSPGRFLKTVPK